MRIVGDTIYKSDDERTDPVGGQFSLRDEYQALQRMHRSGAAVPEPGGYDSQTGEYGMEHIDGVTITEIDEAYDDITAEDRERIEGRLEDDLEKIHDSGIPHGDVCTSNIIVDSELRPHYIDPAGFGQDHPDAAAVMERDRQNLAYITDRFL
jgi:RIO-like serine/threonine protein kinase